MASPALRYHGAKFRLAPWVQRFFPPHACYVEPFGGAAGVLLQKPRAYAEVYNDLDGDIVNFFRVLRDPVLCAQLVDACQLTPYARAEFELAFKPTDNQVERARRTAVRAAMGFGSASATKGTCGFRTDTRRSYGTAQHIWQRYPDSLSSIAELLQGVLIENRPAIGVMQTHDGPDTLHFVDPPYLPETRERPGRGYYRHEMTADQHAELLDAVDGLAGMVVLCGYPSELYDTRLAHWQRHTTVARISGQRGTSNRTEVIWINQACANALHRFAGGLFAEPETYALS